MKTQRSSGIILHITSLPGPYGIGDLGPEAYRFADLLSNSCIKFWQLLPLNPIASRTGYSPYSSTSAFAGNTLLISPDLLVQDGFLDKKDLPEKPKSKDVKVAFEKAEQYKNELLQRAYQHFTENGDAKKKAEFKAFCKAQAGWLNDYALFTVIDEKFGKVSWVDWPKELRNREQQALQLIEKGSAKDLEFVKFGQFLFYRQWNDLRQYCHQKNVYFFGDLPFYVSMDSAEVWANPENFKLDKNRKPITVSGVPPDYFSETGQLWGTPVYNWKVLKKNKYDWWVKRLAHNIELFDVARIDHFRALYNFWEVPAGEKTAVNGSWSLGPADDFFKTLQKAFPDMPFIAEDLGDVHQAVFDLRDRFNLPGMVVLQYGFAADIATSPYAFHNIRENMIAYTGTHDNNTTKGWYKTELKPDERQRLSNYVNYKVNTSNVSKALVKLAMMSRARLAIVPLQDILDLDEKAIMNKPSVGEGNWTWRVTQQKLDSIKPKDLKEMLELYNRVAEQEED